MTPLTTPRESLRPFHVLPALLLALSIFVSSSLLGSVDVTVTKLGSRSMGSSESLGATTDELIAEIESKLGLSFQGPLSLVLCSDLESFDSYASSLSGGHAEVFGFFAPPEIIRGSLSVPSIALNLQRIDESNARAREVYKHELVHAVLHQNILWRLRPLWFEEGLAQWVSKTPYESALRELGHAGGSGENPISLSHVSDWMRDPSTMGDAYAHGLAAVQMLESMHGEDGIRRLLAAMRTESQGQGTSSRFEELYNTVFGASFHEFQRRFVEKRQRTDWARVLGFVGANLWALLMLAGTVLIFIGIRRKRKREAQMVETWNVIDQEFPPDPDWAIDAKAPEIRNRDSAEVAMEEHDDHFADPFEDAMREHQELYGDEGEEWKRGQSKDGGE